MKTQKTKNKTQKFNFWLIIGLFSFLFSCVDQETFIDSLDLQKRVEAHGLEFISLNKNEAKGLKVKSLKEFEIYLMHISGKSAPSKEVLDLYKKNGYDLSLGNLTKKVDLQEDNSSSFNPTDRIFCLHNPGSVYAKLNTGNPLVKMEVTFQYGSGSGKIENYDGSLSGITAGVSLGKNTLNQDTYPTSSGGSYSGILTFQIQYSIFFEGIGTIYTSESVRYRVRVEACNGIVTWAQIVE